MTAFEAWFGRKLKRRRLTVRQPREVRHVHKRPIGPRSYYAGIRLRVEPADEFSFASDAAWPEGERGDAYEQSILDGVLDELLARDVGPVVTHVKVAVLSIEFHPVDSSQHAFYEAARGAIREALRLEDGESNVDWQFGAG
jgi:translation elongation factor EF-G